MPSWHDGTNFVDFEFPRSLHSLGGLSPDPNWQQVTWRRLRDIAPPGATLFVEAGQGGAIQPGALVLRGSSTALPVVAFQQFAGVDFASQNWFRDNHLSQDGHYKVTLKKGFEVEIDDFVPCIGDALAGTSSSNPLELWPVLLEKACAKVLRSYSALVHPSYALKARAKYVERLMSLVEEREGDEVGRFALHDIALHHAFGTLWDSGIPALSNPYAVLPLESPPGMAQALMPQAHKGGAAIVLELSADRLHDCGAFGETVSTFGAVCSIRRVSRQPCLLVLQVLSPKESLLPAMKLGVRLRREASPYQKTVVLGEVQQLRRSGIIEVEFGMEEDDDRWEVPMIMEVCMAVHPQDITAAITIEAYCDVALIARDLTQ